MGRNCEHSGWKNSREGLKSNNNELRYEAAFAIGELASEEALPDLIKLIDDRDIRVQEAAIRDLGK